MVCVCVCLSQPVFVMVKASSPVCASQRFVWSVCVCASERASERERVGARKREGGRESENERDHASFHGAHALSLTPRPTRLFPSDLFLYSLSVSLALARSLARLLYLL
jgi:hypothetical protein